MLERDIDEYLKCSLKGKENFVIVRFNEDIKILNFMILNNEPYSSNIKFFSVINLNNQ